MIDSFSSFSFGINAFSPASFDFKEEAGVSSERSDISRLFTQDFSRLHLLPNEIAQRRKLLAKRKRDQELADQAKRRRRELELISLYAITRIAA